MSLSKFTFHIRSTVAFNGPPHFAISTIINFVIHTLSSWRTVSAYCTIIAEAFFASPRNVNESRLAFAHLLPVRNDSRPGCETNGIRNHQARSMQDDTENRSVLWPAALLQNKNKSMINRFLLRLKWSYNSLIHNWISLLIRGTSRWILGTDGATINPGHQ